MEEDLLDILVPIQPSDSSIQSHIAALDLLAARLSILTSQTRLPARIPLNSKASFSGSVIHTNDVKVIVGGERWVEMTAEEAVGYVRRRKNGELGFEWSWIGLIGEALLVEHARLQEGARRDISTTGVSENEVAGPSPRTAFPPTIHLNPLFGRSAVAGPTRHPAAPAIIESSAQEKSSEPDTLARSGPVAASKAESSLADVLDEFVETQRVLANDTGKRKGRVSKEEAAVSPSYS